MAEPLRGRQESSWKWEGKTLREFVTVYPLHYLLLLCCNNHVYYFCLAAKHNTRTSPYLLEFGFRYSLEKLPLATGDEDNVQLSKWHQKPT
jgi:hypothetical protein